MSWVRHAHGRWSLSWLHVVLALAVGAGLPVLWLALAPPLAPAADVSGAAPPPPVTTAAVATPPASPTALAVPAGAAAPPAAATASPPAPTPQIPRMRDPEGDQTPDIADFVNPGEVPSMAEVIARLRAAGVQGGLAAFNPPGTRPPLVGIAVADDVELPPGYVRHHQVTDDGQRIEPILMFAPDHPLLAAAGPAAAPQDRVVPPALAPAGLPIRHIVVPAPAAPGK